jgi:hypothetical protein
MQRRLCECGCGSATPLIVANYAAKGRVKGQYSRFIAGHHARARSSVPAPERFARFFEKSEGCWEWRGTRRRSGHGSFNAVGNRPVLAHRYAWELQNGPIPDGMCVCHRCDNPPCVNPAHLFLGTQRDNVRDMRQKGRGRGLRHGAGAANNSAKLTAEQVREIRARLAAGEGRKSIAPEYGVHFETISTVGRRDSWQDV